MISKQRAEELLKMPFALVLEPAITKVSSAEVATQAIAALSEMPGIYLFEDVVNLAPKDLDVSGFKKECFNALKQAIKLLLKES